MRKEYRFCNTCSRELPINCKIILKFQYHVSENNCSLEIESCKDIKLMFTKVHKNIFSTLFLLKEYPTFTKQASLILTTNKHPNLLTQKVENFFRELKHYWQHTPQNTF